MIFFESIRALIIFTLTFIIALILTTFFLKIIKNINLKKVNIRDEKSAPIFYQYHKEKKNTPTMAGIIIWGSVLILSFFFFLFHYLFDGFFSYFNFLNRAETYLPLFFMLFAAILGLIDDIFGILKIGPHGGGLKIKHKLILYIIIALFGAWWFYFKLGFNSIYLPFFGEIYLGYFYILYFIFILLGTTFAFNETDGLDGLSSGVALFAFGSFLIIAFILKKYDLAMMLASLLGALLAFLWFNIYPARFFMGDTGSMSLGVTLAIVSLLTNTSLLLVFFAFIPLIETLSVIIQLLSKKIRKKKIFYSTPIHHHFQALNWPESQITMRFWIISAVFSAFGLIIFLIDKFA